MRAVVKVAAPIAIAGMLAGGVSTAGAALIPNVSPSARTSWQVVAPNWSHSNKQVGRVDDIARDGKRVYLAGDFTEMANHSGKTVTRNHIAAVTAGGDLLPFKPNINGRVYALALSPNGKFLYVGGQFSSINGRARHNLAAFVVKTGRLAKRIPNLKLGGQVRGLAATRSGLYVGGSFGSVSGKRRGNLAKFVLTRKGMFKLSAWAPSANADVRDLVVDRRTGRVIFAGDFTAVNGKSAHYLAAVTSKGGRQTPWASRPTADILDLSMAGRVLYAAEGGPGGTALSYNLKGGTLRWYYKTDGNCQAVTTIDDYPVFGMHGDNVATKRNTAMKESGGSARVQRHKVFMLSPKGVLMAWNPNVSSNAGVLGVWALKAGKGNVYMGGDFTGVHGVTQQRFAILPGR